MPRSATGRSIRYRKAPGARTASACAYALGSVEVLRSEPYLALQEETAEDTAAHLRDVELHRLVGVGPIPRDVAPMLLAAIVCRWPAGGDDRVRRYASEWKGAPCALALRELVRRPDDPAALAGAAAKRWWLLRTVGAHHSRD